MPFFFIIAGLILVIAAARGTHRDLGELIRNDFSGENNFFVWIIAIFVVGSIGYYSPAQKFSRYFLGLILIVMLLSNKGFFRQLVDALSSTTGGAAAGTGAAGNTLDSNPSPLAASASGGGTAGAGASGGATVNVQQGLNTVKGVAGILKAGAAGGNLQGVLNGIGPLAGNVGGIAQKAVSVISNPLKSIGSFFGF